MDQRYWDRVASDYDGEIFDSFTSDRTGILVRRLDKFADRSAPAADAGCGVGKYLPFLAPRFARVDAYDLSGELLKQARTAAGRFDNIRYFKRNFAARSARVFPVRFALCANVLIMADTAIREAVLRSVARMVESGGHAIFLIPSVESALLAHHRLVEWHRRDGLSAAEASRASIAPAAKAGRRLADGFVPIDGVPTKHFLREEAVGFFRRFGFEPLQFDKVEYGWETEFESPPEWMQGPFPWDWLVTTKRL
ncbi:MAG: class I SAM-dependent methyltransferase [Terrimicrobiaceae bacterium]